MATGAAGADGIFRGIFDGCISGHDTGIQRRPYHKNCTCELHKSKGNCSHSSRCANISYKIRRSWSESCLSSSAGSSSPATGGKKNLVRSNTGSGYEESCLALTANISTARYSWWEQEFGRFQYGRVFNVANKDEFGSDYNGILGLGLGMESVVTHLGWRFSFCIDHMNDSNYPYNNLVIDEEARIKMELFGAAAITRKIISEGGLIVVDGAIGGGSGATVGANDAPLTIFKAKHYEYDHIGYTDFASPSEYSAYKCQDCRAKHDVVINAINVLTASVKELTSKRGLIPSKRILFSSAPLEIRAKRRGRVISRALSGIQKSEIATPLSACCTEQRTMSKGEQHKLKKKLGGYDYFDWYEERHPSQENRVVWGLLNKVKASEEKQNRARRYYIIAVIATGLVLLGTWILKPNC
ncbi:hypothetical protein CQW23_16438 [Capsicum baccatum]|uniref:Xylanase inhibitor N-terminal domain-containing protein n=1 Tax=Capsicum baccatum TaxID=33114 RepID=A0A2G2WAY0_CAPBA|nr:hypothetical protein CQW23_16438 [Capsicum baccatum]